MHLIRTNMKRRGYFSWILCFISVSFLCSMILFLSSCAFSKYGKADVTAFEIKAPEGLVGLSKSEIIDRLGPPEGGISDEKGAEYWVYNNMNSHFLFIYGKGLHKTMLLKLEDNTVIDVRLIEKGSSFGFLTGGM